MAPFALLIGLVIVPAGLLWLGHRLRERSRVQRGAFWGGVIGHTLALLIAVAALHFPPVLWTSEPRMTIAFWSLLLGAVVGAVLGAVRASARAIRR